LVEQDPDITLKELQAALWMEQRSRLTSVKFWCQRLIRGPL
jgi:hypothetical protein